MGDRFLHIPGARLLTEQEQKEISDALGQHANERRNRQRKPSAFDTGPLMSSLREMVTAEVQAHWYEQVGEVGLAGAARLNYSRHEAVVREQLQELADVASSYKAPPRMGGNSDG